MASHISHFEEVFSDDDEKQASTPSPTTPPLPASIKQPPVMEGPRLSELPTPHRYPTFGPNTKEENIIRGGFGPPPKPARQPFRCYPPPPNAAYSVDAELRVPRLYCERIEREVDGLEGLGIDGMNLDPRSKIEIKVKNYIKSRVEVKVENDIKSKVEVKVEDDSEEEAPELFDGKTKGQILADKMDFKRPCWVTVTAGVSGTILPPDEQKRDFIGVIDQNKSGKAELELELCYRCYKRHIIPGSPLTLGDRDKCYSSLPDWFPREIDGDPWEKFTGLMNEIVILQETMSGYGHRKDPSKPQWDLHFHDKNRGWTTQQARRYGGWWKCRSGPNAPEIEQKCEHCHKAKTQDEIDAARRAIPIAVQLQQLYEFVDRRFKEQGVKDKEAALAMLKSQGIPQHFGTPMDDAERTRLMDVRGNGSLTKNRSRVVLDMGDPSTPLSTNWRDANGESSTPARFSAPTSSSL